MALTIKASHATLVKMLHLDSDFVDNILKVGFELQYDGKLGAFQWHVKNTGETASAPVVCTKVTFDKIVKGKASPLALQQLRNLVLQAIMPEAKTYFANAAELVHALTNVPIGTQTPMHSTAPIPKKPGIMGQLPASVAALAKPKPVITGVDFAAKTDLTDMKLVKAAKASGLIPGVNLVFPLDKMEAAPVVLLRDADALYQPVKGSGSGSRYFVVGMAHGLRMAARYTDATLSVRIEGMSYVDYVKTIEAFGFSHVSPGAAVGAYASMHLPCPTEAIASKALGAIMFGLGIEWQSPMPAVQLIAGKGK